MDANDLFRIRSTAASAVGLVRTAHVREDRDDQVGGEPDIVVTHVLVNVDQDQDTREKYAEQ